MPRPVDPGRSPHPHQCGCFVLASRSLTHSPPATCSISRLYPLQGTQVTPVAYAILCVRFVYFVRLSRSFLAARALRRKRNTRYGWVVNPFPTGTSTRQDTPSFLGAITFALTRAAPTLMRTSRRFSASGSARLGHSVYVESTRALHKSALSGGYLKRIEVMQQLAFDGCVVVHGQHKFPSRAK